MHGNTGFYKARSIAHALFAVLLSCAACGDDDGGGGGSSGTGGGGTPCSHGAVFSCVGRGGCAGTQLCGSNGFLATCTCPVNGGSGAPALDASMMSDASEPVSDAATQDAATQDAATQDAGEDAAAPDDEDCTNDVDDDGDGDADCADDDCTERACVEAAPDGWTGPLLVSQGEDAVSHCSGTYPDEVIDGGRFYDAPPAICSECTCSGGTPSCATFLNFETGADAQCDGNSCTNSVGSSCALLTLPAECLNGATTGYVNTVVPGAAGGCTPSPQVTSLPGAAWEQRVLACAPDHALARAGCGSDELCAPAKSFDGQLCIAKSGDLACPSGPYTDRQVYYTGVDDTRACSACACDDDCSYTWLIFDPADTTCATPLLSPTTENACVAVTPASNTLRVGVAIDPGDGACAPSGGASIGAAPEEDPVTVCCTE